MLIVDIVEESIMAVQNRYGSVTKRLLSSDGSVCALYRLLPWR